MNFKDYNLDKNILKALDNLNYIKPTSVQNEVILKLIDKKDIIVKSKTGSGKTASFSIPICENIEVENKNVQALIIVPTRELALQVKEEISNIGRFKKVRCSAIFGKQPIKEQIHELKQRVHVVVATPGRIIDHIQRETINLNNLKYFIIDEADKMLSKGFIDDIDKMFKVIKNTTVGLFSATIDNNLDYVCKKYMKNPIKIEIENNSLKQIDEYVLRCSDDEKYDTLKKIIDLNSTIIFCNTKEEVIKLAKKMKKDKYNLREIHGDMSQEKRLFTMKDFKNQKFNILVSTDVSSRGIHIDDISLVINYDVPKDRENYVHRIGRTGRFNNFGKSITMVTKKDEKYLNEIEDYLNYKIKECNICDLKPSEVKIKKVTKKVNSEITKLYLNAGKKKKIRTLDILGAFSNLDEISADDIGVIDVKDLCSYVDILNDKGKIILKKYKQINIKKKLVKIKKDNSDR